MTLCDIAEDREQCRELVALAAVAESSWTMKTWPQWPNLDDRVRCLVSAGGILLFLIFVIQSPSYPMNGQICGDVLIKKNKRYH